MNAAQLEHIMPNATITQAMVGELESSMAEFGIVGRLDQCAFIANVAHESGQLRYLGENLNYSADALLSTWPSHFDLASAAAYARQPERIANRVYANRGGNSNEASGDGWAYRGAGAIEVTFHDNHLACAQHFGRTLADIGPWLRTLEGALRSAGWFWQMRHLSDQSDFDAICDIVNIGHHTIAIGDSSGYADRVAFFQRAQEVL